MCIHTETCTRLWLEAVFVTAENNPDIFQWVNCGDLRHGIQLHHKRNKLLPHTTSQMNLKGVTE